MGELLNEIQSRIEFRGALVFGDDQAPVSLDEWAALVARIRAADALLEEFSRKKAGVTAIRRLAAYQIACRGTA